MARAYAYTTSAEHRILGLTESVAGSASATWTYSYDLADRLTQVLASPGGAYGYDLDPGDNLLGIQTPDSAVTTTYDSLNQIALRNAQPFRYDAAGNLADDGQRTYAWDAEQRLVRIGYTGTDRATEFRYDGLGRRTAIVEHDGAAPTETRYRWCGERICQARNGSDTVIRRYYDEGEQAVTATGTSSYYYAQDHLGSVRDLVNASGTVLASYDYDPYGNPTRVSETGGIRADYRYAGLFYHAPSGLYLTHYRVYDPVTARWLSRDPIGEIGGINLYGYVGGNPITYTDETGELPWVAVAVWAAQAAWGAYQGYQASEAFNEAQCENPPLDPGMNEGEGPMPSQVAGHTSQTVANVASAYAWGFARAMAAVAVAHATGGYGKAPATVAGFAVGAYFGASSDCDCP